MPRLLQANGTRRLSPQRRALRHQEAVLEVSAGDERFELVPHESRQRAGALLEPLAERRPVLAHQGEGVAVLGGPRNVARLSVTVGHCTALLMRKPGHSRIAVFEGGCTARGSPGGPRVDQPHCIVGHTSAAPAAPAAPAAWTAAHTTCLGRATLQACRDLTSERRRHERARAILARPRIAMAPSVLGPGTLPQDGPEGAQEAGDRHRLADGLTGPESDEFLEILRLGASGQHDDGGLGVICDQLQQARLAPQGRASPGRAGPGRSPPPAPSSPPARPRQSRPSRTASK